MEKNIEISILSQIYKSTLTEKLFEILDENYNNDLSLSEIAENYNITRQAVRDNIKSGEAKLYDLEHKLGLMKKSEKQQKIVEDIITKLDNLEIQDKEKINSIKVELINKNTGKVVKTTEIQDEELQTLKSGQKLEKTYENLVSNTTYEIKITSKVIFLLS